MWIFVGRAGLKPAVRENMPETSFFYEASTCKHGIPMPLIAVSKWHSDHGSVATLMGSKGFLQSFPPRCCWLE
jgi:hypothetical protein